MNVIVNVILAVQMLAALAMIGLILIQHGKGADMGAAFGSGSSGSLFGASGSANFLSRTTAILAAIFFLSSLGLTWFATTHTEPSGVMQQKGVMEKMAPKTSDVPSTPGTTPAPSGNAPSGTATPGTPATAPATDVPKAPPASDGSKSSEVPK